MEAERIAKEIERSGNHADVDEQAEHDLDEEAKFSAVTGTGAYTGSSGAASSAKARGKAAASETASTALQLPLPKAGLSAMPPDRLAGESPAGQTGDAARDYRRQRGMIVAHSPMHSSMISEMKRINALNLEPAVPKLDDKTGTDWINFKASQSRNKTNPSQGDGLKSAFEHDLAVIQKRESQKLQQKSQDSGSA